MCHLGTRFSGGLGSVRFTIGLNDLKHLFQPKLYYEPVILGIRVLVGTF